MLSKSLRRIPVCFLVLMTLVFGATGSAQGQASDSAKVDASASQPSDLPPGTETRSAVPILSGPSTPGSASVAEVASTPGEAATGATATPIQPVLPNAPPTPTPPPPCNRMVSAEVVALPHPIMLNRLGASVPDALVFALKSDTTGSGDRAWLNPDKRPRPIVLRANVGDCLQITFSNSIPKNNFSKTTVPGASIETTEVSLHIQGMEWANNSNDDGSFVGRNTSSLASTINPAVTPVPPQTLVYNLYAKEEGTFLLYTMGDTSTQGTQLQRGLFGALNVQPKDSEWYRSQVTREDLRLATTKIGPDGHPVINYAAVYPAGHPRAGMPILNMLDTRNNQNKIVHSDLTAIITGLKAGRFAGTTGPNKPEPPCNAEGNPALGPVNGKGDPLFCQNPASPDRKQPYREVTIIYHEVLDAVTSQAFPVFTDPAMQGVVAAGKDAFAINYGTGGISAEVYANRIGVGPMANCVDCKFEEFFLSAWSVGDPAMLVDRPANVNIKPPVPTPAPLCTSANLEGTNSSAPNSNCANARKPEGAPRTGNVAFVNGNATVTGTGTKFTTELAVGDQLVLGASPGIVRGTVKTITSDTQVVLQAKAGASGSGAYGLAEPYVLPGLLKATQAYFPDDPSNVYHSYINDHTKFRILHGGTGVSHVHHQHAHQWLQSPNSDEGSYLDSQMISPGASYTLEMTYNGSGNRNKVVGDSIFHCHFYPHFASGMWAMWRTHDVFEGGTELDRGGIPLPSARALPDGEILAGTPIPAIVPLPTIPMAPLPSDVYIANGQVFYGKPTDPVDPSDPKGEKKVKETPGFPFFIPGVAGARAPHPPLDFAPDTVNGGLMDGGLPRHVVTGGEISYERHTKLDWSKDLEKVEAIELPEGGTHIEKVAMQFFSRRCQPSAFPDGTPGSCPSSSSTPPQSTLINPPTGFILNGLPLGPQSGAPFADPAIDDNGNAVNFDNVTKVQTKRVYKAAAIQVNLVFNKKPISWHFPQGRILTLWNDVKPTIDFTFGKPGRQPEPLFFRGNSGDIIEYWHTNLVPSYYIVDDFQVRTPTDILGQHIHLVKFDVTSSDGAGNGFNYEDGTFSPQEVQETIKAINANNGFTNAQGTLLKPKLPPAEIFDCAANPGDPRCKACTEHWTPTSRPQCQSWMGAQTTIQRWYLDPLLDNSGNDRTLRTVFTHDHFGPSTHQQAGLYAGLLVEPLNSTWRNSETGTTMGRSASLPPIRPDGGPTSWKADILVKQDDKDVSYREFALEFQDFLLAYMTKQIAGKEAPKYPNATSQPNSDPSKGYINNAYSIGAPASGPTLVSTQTVGSYSVNYLNEPVPYRIGTGDPSEAFNSAMQPCPPGTSPAGSCQPNAQLGGDPITPLLRAYQGDKVQIRILVGAHMFAHQFNLEGPTWFAEPSWKNSGYRSVQAMGLSEHFELLFNTPSSSAPKVARKCPDGMSAGNCVDYLYSPSLDEFGVSNGLWGLFRAYDPNKKADKLVELPNNKIGSASVEYQTCPDGAPKRTFNVSAVTAQHALSLRSPISATNPKGQIVFNDRGAPATAPLSAPRGLMYVRTEDLTGGKLKDAPIEPLILRANAGDCITVNLKNEIPYNSDVFNQTLTYAQPMDNLPGVVKVAPSRVVGLHPQLLSYDAANSFGSNVGFNTKGGQPSQTAKYNETITYNWYAGKIERNADGKLTHTPVEFGTLNLFPADPLFQASNSLFGSMIIEPQRSTWLCGEAGNLRSCDPPPAGSGVVEKPPTSRASATVTKADGSTFREFVAMISDAIRISGGNSSAVNYGTEPKTFRYPASNVTKDFSCMLSDQLVGNLDPETPVFTAAIGDKVRFRMAHPFGTGTSQVFTVHGHSWQRNPYANESTEIGDNSLSQSLGSRDNHGATDHFEIVLEKAGGESGTPGDYLYSVFLPSQAKLGAWGLFRVGAPFVGPQPPNGACVPVKAPPAPAAAPKETDKDREGFIRQPINKEAKP